MNILDYMADALFIFLVIVWVPIAIDKLDRIERHLRRKK